MESVFAGLQEVSSDKNLIAIHDGARPFVTDGLLREVILRAAECGAAAPDIPVKDTVKRVKKGMVEETLARQGLYCIQTPQVFEASLIRAALTRAIKERSVLTDDCAAVERMGMKVALTRGSEENIKITTPADLLLAEVILEGRELK
jgi:4-diphosphocytidyl-2-methyl-D-erithritol synthase